MGPKNRKIFQLLWGMLIMVSVALISRNVSLSSDVLSSPNETPQFSPLFSAYVYPNPVKENQTPVLVVEPGDSEKITAQVYTVSGELVSRIQFDPLDLQVVNGAVVTEHSLNSAHLCAGVYAAVVTGYKNDQPWAGEKVFFTVLQ